MIRRRGSSASGWAGALLLVVLVVVLATSGQSSVRPPVSRPSASVGAGPVLDRGAGRVRFVYLERGGDGPRILVLGRRGCLGAEDSMRLRLLAVVGVGEGQRVVYRCIPPD